MLETIFNVIKFLAGAALILFDVWAAMILF